MKKIYYTLIILTGFFFIGCKERYDPPITFHAYPTHLRQKMFAVGVGEDTLATGEDTRSLQETEADRGRQGKTEEDRGRQERYKMSRIWL